MPLRSGIKPYKHQILAYRYLEGNDQFALFMEQGTGKTLPVLMRIDDLLHERERSVLIVAPKASLGAWFRDIEKFDDESQALLLRNTTIINYDRVWRKSGNNPTGEILVLDEAHKIKNHTTVRAQYVLGLSLKATHRYILTGAPINNGKIEDIWSQFTFLFPLWRSKRTGVVSQHWGAYYDFLERYCRLDQYYKPYMCRNVHEIQQVIDDYSFRVLKAECLDLPDKLPDEILDIEPLEKQRMSELTKHNTLEEYQMIAANPLARMTKLRQLCSGFIMVDDEQITNLKCEKPVALHEFLQDFEKKLVIFAEYRESIDRICKVLEKNKRKCVVLDGRQKDKQIWRKFQEDEEIRVIVCQYQSASEGIDLYAADTIFYYEPTISSNILEQSRDRIHRSSQKQKCSYIHFITTGSIEEMIYKRLKDFKDFDTKFFTTYMGQYQRISYRRHGWG